MTLDILLPYYGDPELMRLAVRSVRDQADPDWRLVVVDDGYPDASIPDWFAGLDDDRITYHRNEQNLGANGNYRRCLEFIENEFAVVMGADDVMRPNYVGRIKALIQQYPDAGVIQPGVELIDEGGNVYRNLVDEVKQRIYAPKVEQSRMMQGQELAASLLRGNWLYFPALVWRSAALRKHGFREGLNVVQDLALVMDLLLAGENMVIDSTVCFQYRRHRASDSSMKALNGDRFIEERRFFLDIADEMDEHGWPQAAKAARNHVSSRLHALTSLPGAVRHKHKEGVQNLVRHAFASPKRK